MSAMNLATQKRLGRLPKTEDTLSYKGHTYGNTHRGFGMRNPTPTSKGFFGVHGFGSAAGDGKLHYFGNGPGQADLPADGFYGLGNTAMMSQAADMLIADPTENQPTNPAGIYGGLPVIASPQVGLAMLAAGLFVANRNNSKKDPVALALMAGGVYAFVSGAKNDSF
jgi:hypothetical protein